MKTLEDFEKFLTEHDALDRFWRNFDADEGWGGNKLSREDFVKYAVEEDAMHYLIADAFDWDIDEYFEWHLLAAKWYNFAKSKGE